MEKPEYDEDAAVIVTYQNLPPATQSEIDEEDVRIILDLLFEYQKSISLVMEEGENDPFEDYRDIVNSPEVFATVACPWVYEWAQIIGCPFTLEQIYEVFEAELCYCVAAGLVNEEIPTDQFIDLKKAAVHIRTEMN